MFTRSRRLAATSIQSRTQRRRAQTMQAVCTDGHSSHKRKSPRKPRRSARAGGEGGTDPGSAAPLGGLQPVGTGRGDRWGRGLDRCQTPFKVKGQDMSHTPDAPQRLELNCNAHVHNNGEWRPGHMATGFMQMDGTHISLLCINSMRSVKRTSRFLSQKPSAS